MTFQPSRPLTILGQDPSLRHPDGKIVTARILVPNEQLSAGPHGYRVQVIDYDSSLHQMYIPLEPVSMGTIDEPLDPFADGPSDPDAFNARLLYDPRFHAQNVYAIVMRTLSHFERALGRRVSWEFGGHQLKVAPHAFAEANAYYSPKDEGLLFGYFAGQRAGKGAGKETTVFNCLSHDIVAHETAHALLGGLRPRYMEPSTPDQAAFHEGFADVVALLSVFSIPAVVEYAVRTALANTKAAAKGKAGMMSLAHLTVNALKRGILLGLGEQFGEELSGIHGSSLRRSVELKPSPTLLDEDEYREEHRRGEVLVAALLQGFLSALTTRLSTLGRDSGNQLPETRVIEEGADIAERLLTMAIRALDYMPTTDIEFGDYVCALVTSDTQIRPDDSRYEMRKSMLDAFSSFGIEPTSTYKGTKGLWKPPVAQAPVSGRSAKKVKASPPLNYSLVHREALQRDRDEVFRFLWDNRVTLGLCEQAYTEVCNVLPCLRVDQDGFTLRETVADYIQILTVRAHELPNLEIPGKTHGIALPWGLSPRTVVRLLGGGALLFDEFGALKYHIRNNVLEPKRQGRRLKHLVESGFFDQPRFGVERFARLHLKGMRPEQPAFRKERNSWR